MIIFYILTTLSLDNVWTLLGENCCWSLLGLKGLNRSFCKRPEKINGKWRSWQNSQVITLSHLSHTSVLPSCLSCHLVVWTYYYGPGARDFPWILWAWSPATFIANNRKFIEPKELPTVLCSYSITWPTNCRYLPELLCALFSKSHHLATVFKVKEHVTDHFTCILVWASKN